MRAILETVCLAMILAVTLYSMDPPGRGVIHAFFAGLAEQVQP